MLSRVTLLQHENRRQLAMMLEYRHEVFEGGQLQPLGANVAHRIIAMRWRHDRAGELTQNSLGCQGNGISAASVIRLKFDFEVEVLWEVGRCG